VILCFNFMPRAHVRGSIKPSVEVLVVELGEQVLQLVYVKEEDLDGRLTQYMQLIFTHLGHPAPH
jgi:hypothetical protein